MAQTKVQHGGSLKTNAVHWGLMIAMSFGLFLLSFYFVIPTVVSGFVRMNFDPSGEKMLKLGYARFQDGVWASISKDKEKEIVGKNLPIKKEYINKEFIFDFTFSPRTDQEHGYVKEATHWYVKAEALGENAIILQPWLGFTILSLVVSMFISLLVTMVLPSNIGVMATLFDRQIENTRVKIKLQTGFPYEIVDLLIMPDEKFENQDRESVERAFRYVWDRTVTEEVGSNQRGIRFEEEFSDNQDIVTFRQEEVYERIKQYYSDFVVKEIEDTRDGIAWQSNHWALGKGLRLYMAHHFTEKYSNNVTALAYGGAAFLIVAVGIRGLKFIPAAKPSFILLAIFLEFTMLALLAVTMFYTEEEERMDRMLKKMEDANKSQLEALRGQQHDIHKLTNALVGQTSEIIKARVEKAITEYMTSTDQVQNAIAEEIGAKIMAGLRDAYSATTSKR